MIVTARSTNVVVNGDADLVSQFDPAAQRCRAERVDAIEKPSVREAMVRIMESGEETFVLRRRKREF